MRTIYHLELTVKNGDERITNHSYYTSLLGLYIDNQEDLTVSIDTLKRAKFPYSRSDYYYEWTIRRGIAPTTTEVRDYKEAQDNI